MGLTVYWDPRSAPCRAVVLFMRVANIPHAEKVVDIFKGEHKTAEYLEKTPIGQVPIVENDGLVLTESTVILQFACHNMMLPDHWFPKMAIKRARIQEYLLWHESNGHGKDAVFVNMVLYPLLKNIPVNEMKLKEACTQLESRLNILETYFLKRCQFLAADQISIADVMAYASLTQSRLLNYPIGKNRPLVTAWLAKVDAQLAPYADEVNTMIRQTCQPHRRDFETMRPLDEQVNTTREEFVTESPMKEQVGEDEVDAVAFQDMVENNAAPQDDRSPSPDVEEDDIVETPDPHDEYMENNINTDEEEPEESTSTYSD